MEQHKNTGTEISSSLCQWRETDATDTSTKGNLPCSFNLNTLTNNCHNINVYQLPSKKKCYISFYFELFHLFCLLAMNLQAVYMTYLKLPVILNINQQAHLCICSASGNRAFAMRIFQNRMVECMKAYSSLKLKIFW